MSTARLVLPVLALACLGLAAPAPAQPREARVGATQVRLPGAVHERHRVRIEGLRDNGQAALDRPLGQGWALAGFGLRFANGDHKLRRIGVLGEGRFARFALADRNGDDPFNAEVVFTALPGIRVQQVSAEGGGKFEIPLPGKAPPNSTLVLSGFEFRRSDGSDANLRSIGIWTVPGRRVIQVSLIDDQGVDFRQVLPSLGPAAAAAALGLPGALESGSVAAGFRAVNSPVNGRYDVYRSYKVAVQYAWVPNSRIQAQGALSGTRGSRAAPPRERIDALQGFEFTFTNSDHHLLELALNPDGSGSASFRDNNLDDPMQWSATYVSLRPEP